MKPSLIILSLIPLLVGCAKRQPNEVGVKTVEMLTPVSYEKLLAGSTVWPVVEKAMSDSEKKEWLKAQMPWTLYGELDGYLAAVQRLDLDGDGVDDHVYSGSG